MKGIPYLLVLSSVVFGQSASPLHALLAQAPLAQAPPAQEDVILKAMRDELQRSMTLKLLNLEKPYYIDYQLDDALQFSASASLGGLIHSNEAHFRIPRVHVRVGGYSFDNTNYVASGYNFGPRYDIRLPLDNSYQVVRRELWLATDQSYKSALEAIARKRGALKNMSVTDQMPDFSPAKPVRLVEPTAIMLLPSEPWTGRARDLSEVFVNYPKLKSSGVDISLVDGMHYFLTSEGTEVREHQGLGLIRARASAQAPDGMTLRDAVVFQARDVNHLPGETEMKRDLESMARNLTALAQSPAGETYSGPVLFEGVAAAQIFAEVLGRNLALTRKPVLEPGSPGTIPVSELEGRQGARILPEYFNLVDDPTQQEYRGRQLFGSYAVDDEGIKAAPLSVVEKGVLKTFVLTRQPVRGFSVTNGHARLPGAFGANAAAVSNLFVSASESSPLPELRKKLLEACKQRDKPYGIIVRKMDFPSSATIEEARRILSGSGQSGSSRSLSLPIMVYRVYPDGREELIRGVRFRGFNVRSLKDIMAASNDVNFFDYLENGAPFALMGGSEAAEVTVVAPSILIDDLELFKMEDELPKLPIVPPPTISRAGPIQTSGGN